MLGPSCVTSSDGGCTIDLKAAKQQQAAKNGANSGFQPSMDSATQTALITADGHGPLLVPDLPNSGRYRSSSSSSSDNKQYMATLVLDRKLVKPGDELHVTGRQLWAAAGMTRKLNLGAHDQWHELCWWRLGHKK